MPFILGIDCGLTVSKVVVFETSGRPVATARRRVSQIIPEPRHIERDMNELWQITAKTIQQALQEANCDPADVLAISATAHGDGLYLLDKNKRPLRNGILSLDSRAASIVSAWEEDKLPEEALKLSGQVPHASAPSAILAWIKMYEPDVYDNIGSILACKDWLRFCLTGILGTDLTEASTSFTDVTTQKYSTNVLSLYGLEALVEALPVVSAPDEIVGYITHEAANMCGLRVGTPVVAGLHDVTASALGAGGYGLGTVAVVAGTYSINETVSNAPKTDSRWFCRNGIKLGEWNNMSISPASAANYDWFLDTFLSSERKQLGDNIHSQVSHEVEQARAIPSDILFHPYLFGSPHGSAASGSFTGLKGWHNRTDILKSLMEGIAFNHRVHVDALASGFTLNSVKLTGGISRSSVYSQIFADVLGLQVTVSNIDEAAAWGAALCAGTGIGLFDDPVKGSQENSAVLKTYQPDPNMQTDMNELFNIHCKVSDAFNGIWKLLNEREKKDREDI